MKIYILILLVIFPVSAICQNVEKGIVVYTDSVETPDYDKTAKTYNIDTDAPVGSLMSRLGKFDVSYIDNSFMTEGVKRCLRMALDVWEDRLSIDAPVHIMLDASEDIDPSLEIKTAVAYAGNGKNTLPWSLFAQTNENEKDNIHGTITINALINWNTSWSNDGTDWGIDNLQTALLRHIAHVLGFGTSVVQQEGELGFAIRQQASPFDNLVSDGQKTLGSLAVGATSATLNDFFKEAISLYTPHSAYKLFTSPTGYVLYRSGNYFSLSGDNIMNYPYDDRTRLLPISDETLDVMSAIGWRINPYDVHIKGNNTDVLGYGSLYTSHTFCAEDSLGCRVACDWIYQIYDNNAHKYVDAAVGQGTDFILTPTDEGLSYVDEFMCLQGRITCITNGNEYTFPLTLDARPQFVSYKISNVQQTANSDYYSFDITIYSRGATGGDVIVSSDYGTLCTLTLTDSDEQTLHISDALKIGETYLYVNLTNRYGTTTKYIKVNPQSTKISDMITTVQPSAYDVYTMQGVLIGRNMQLSALGKGSYIIRSKADPLKGRKIILK